MRPLRFAPRLLSVGILIQAWISLAAPSLAAVCPVPSAGHPTIGSAVADGTCTTIQLAAGSYPENVEIARDVAVAGAGSAATTLLGALRSTGSGTEVALSGLAVDGSAPGVAGCWPDLLEAAGGGRVVAGPDVVVRNTAAASGLCRIFDDGFESGSALAWSDFAP